ncbi:MAG: membrane protein insertion efficiency factor YidD [Acidobacteriota bacterium]
MKLAWPARVLVGLVLTAGVYDVTRPPVHQFGSRAAVLAIQGYQATLSPVLGQIGVRCRFKPSCSHYAAAVVARDGLLRGSWLTAKRLARCGPWTPKDTLDPP